MYSPTPYTALASSLVAASAVLGVLYLFQAQEIERVPVPPTASGKEDPPSKPVAESAVHVSYRVTSDMADEHGRMYAGEILKLVDIVAGVASRRHAETGCVTITLDRFILVQEVKVGDLLHLSASVNRAWNTSMETGVKVVRENPRTGKEQYCCHAYLTFVALAPKPINHVGPSDSIRLGGRTTSGPRLRPKVKKITPLTLIERKRYLLAGHRRDIRMAQSSETANDLSPFRAEVLEMSKILHANFSAISDDSQRPAIFAMEKELVVAAIQANDPSVTRGRAPDGEETFTLSDKLKDGMDAPVFRMSDLQDLLESRKRGRRNTWTVPGDTMSSDMTRSTSSWMMEPASPKSPKRSLASKAMHVPIIEDVILSPTSEDVPFRMVTMEDTYASTLHIVMPQHANSAGVLFGGQLMEWMEKTALIAAHRLRQEGCFWTTAGMDGLEFREAVAIGDVLTFRAVVTRTWKSSIEVYVCSHADVPGAHSPESLPRFTNECFISLVALSPTASAAIPLDTDLHIESGTKAEQVAAAADARKEARLNLKEMLVRLYASA